MALSEERQEILTGIKLVQEYAERTHDLHMQGICCILSGAILGGQIEALHENMSNYTRDVLLPRIQQAQHDINVIKN